jgi:hypothetical protein
MALPVDGIESLVKEVQELRREVDLLKQGQPRNVSFGTTYRIQVVGTGAAAVLQAVRTADNNTVQIAP